MEGVTVLFQKLFDKESGSSFYALIGGNVDKDTFEKLSFTHYSYLNSDEFNFEQPFKGWISSLEEAEILIILGEKGYFFKCL